MIWVETTLGEVIELFDNKRIPLNSLQRAERQGKYPYYGAQGIIDWVDGYLYDGRFLLVPEDGENLRSRKQPIAFFATGRFWVNNHAHILSGRDGVCDDDFLKHWLNNADISGYITGAAQPKLSQEGLRRIPIKLPDYEIQRRIASILSAYDDLIENNTRRIAILEEMARRIYEEWFVRFRFPGHEKVRMVESELGLIPEDWSIKRLSDFGRVVTGKTPSKADPSNFGEYVPFIKTPDMNGNIFCISTGEGLSFKGAELQRNKKIPPDSLCVSCIGTVGVGVVSITAKTSQTNQQINSIVLYERQYREFLYFALLGLRETMHLYGANGTTMINLNKNKFENMKIVSGELPLIELFHNMVKPMFDLIKIIQYKNINLRTTRDLLLPKLISGELDVSKMPDPENAGIT